MVPDTLRGQSRRGTIVDDRRRGWSIKIGSIGEIPIRIHLTFILLLAWLVAKRFGVLTKDITIYPFGGIASIVSQPSPKAELAIALAGPLLNLVIAGAIYPWITIPDLSVNDSSQIGSQLLSFPLRLFFTNLALAIFNLLPALPMDGGRVLRAGLALAAVKEPTKIAARISQVLCVVLAIAGLYLQQPMLFIIAVIVFFGAMQEHIRVETRAIATAFSIADAMIPKERLESFPHGTTISQALRTSLTSWQTIYPVTNGDALIGLVLREDLLEHAITHHDDYVGEIMKRSIPEIDIAASLADAFSQMETAAIPVLAVTKDGRYTGILAYDRLADFLLLHELRHKMPKDEDIEWTNL
jgi:Zn-dependent protease/CBS domain-containing protein